MLTRLFALFCHSTTFSAEPTELPSLFYHPGTSDLHCGLYHMPLTLGVLVISVCGNVLTGFGPEDPWLSGADRFTSFQV